MYKTTKIFALAVLLLLGPALVSVAQKGDAAGPAEVQNLKIFIGTWKGNMTMKDAMQKSYPVAQTFICTSIAGGNGIYVEEIAESPEMGKMVGSDLIGYDPYGKQMHCFTVDNMGTAHDHLCSWKNDNQFYLEHNSMRDGKKYQEQIDLVFKGTDVMEMNLRVYVDGKLSETVTGSVKKSD